MARKVGNVIIDIDLEGQAYDPETEGIVLANATAVKAAGIALTINVTNFVLTNYEDMDAFICEDLDGIPLENFGVVP